MSRQDPPRAYNLRLVSSDSTLGPPAASLMPICWVMVASPVARPVRTEYERALDLAKQRLGAMPAGRPGLPLAQVTGYLPVEDTSRPHIRSRDRHRSGPAGRRVLDLHRGQALGNPVPRAEGRVTLAAAVLAGYDLTSEAHPGVTQVYGWLLCP